jgi:hypothetical protein
MDWFDEVKQNKLVEGSFMASIKVSCSPRKLLNLRPLITSNGEIEEWHLMVSDPPQIDWKAASNGSKPAPGCPLVTQSVIRFHPDDVDASIDTQKALSDLRTKYEELRYAGDDSVVWGSVIQKPSWAIVGTPN